MVNVNISIFLRALYSQLEITSYGSGSGTAASDPPEPLRHAQPGDGGTADPDEPPTLHTITLNVGDGGRGSNPDPPSEKS